MLSQQFYVIIDHGISPPRHGREVVYGLNAIDKRFLFKLMPAVKIPGEKSYYTQMVIHTGTRTSGVSFSR